MYARQEIRIHGRGGQGVAVMAEMLATAFVIEGKYAASFPIFGSERRGGPVTAFARFSDTPILEKTQVYEPSCLILFDQSSLTQPNVLDGIHPNCLVIVNSSSVKEKPHSHVGLIGFLNANAIAIRELGKPIPNTCLLGAFANASAGWLSLESVLGSLTEYYSGDLLIQNQKCATTGFNEVRLTRL